MDRQQKIAKLKEKQAQKKLAEAKTVKDASNSLEEAVNSLKKAFDVGVEVNGLDQLVDQIAEINIFKESVDELREAIKAMPETVKVEDIDGIVEAIKGIEIKAPDVVMPDQEQVDVIQLVASIISAINKLSKNITENKTVQGQDPEDYIPYRRVIKVGNALIYDDLPHTTGGFGGGSGVPTIGGSVPVVNPDGSNISAGGGGSNTEYTEGDLDTSITGPVLMFEGNATTSEINPVSTNHPLPVELNGGTNTLATEAKQDNGNTYLFNIDSKTPAYGTAGTASADVSTVQGITGGTPLVVDASGTTVTVTDGGTPLQVSGTFYTTNAQYAVIADDVTTGGVVYVGYAAIGSATSAASWRIKKIDTTNYPITTWADGNDSFDNVFDDRVSLTYS